MNQVFMSPSVVNLAPALLKVQQSMANVVKKAENPFFRSSYADLNAIREEAIPALNAEKVVVLQPMTAYDGKTFVRTLLLHESGEFMGSDTEIVHEPGNPQAAGSGISYARRYGLQSLLNIGAVDDDAESAMGRKPAPKTASTSSFRKPKKTKETPVATEAVEDTETATSEW